MRLDSAPRLATSSPAFQARSSNDVFAIYLSRELDDTRHVRWYAKLINDYSPCLLLIALRRARKASTRHVSPRDFNSALQQLLQEKETTL